MKIYPIIFLFGIYTTAFAQDTTSFIAKGTYQGKNLYVQNPFSNDSVFCTREVWVNGERANIEVNRSAYEIDLSHLKTGSATEIKIVHYKNCKPRILDHPVNIYKSIGFKKVAVQMYSIDWTMLSKIKEGTFDIEHFEHNSWAKIDSLTITDLNADSVYSRKVLHFSGENKYRIKYSIPDGTIFYSTVQTYFSKQPALLVTLVREQNVILFSYNANYTLLDDSGKIVSKGYAKYIYTDKLPRGTYYVNADNKTTKIKLK